MDLAAHAGIAQPNVSFLENGIIKVSDDTLAYIAKKLDFPEHHSKLVELIGDVMFL